MSALNPAAEFDYNARVRELFADLRHAGSLSGVSASAGSREQGAFVALFIQTQDGRVQAVRYQAYGCPHFLAACEFLARWLEGRAVAEINTWSWREVENELEVSASKRGRLLLLADAIKTLARAVK